MRVCDFITINEPVERFDGAKDKSWPSDYYIGVEIELEGFKNCPALNFWNTKEDGSLRSYDGMRGYELVTRGAYRNSVLTDALKEVQDMVGRRSSLIPSERTSTQVHLDMSKSEVKCLWNLFAIYMILEGDLFDFAGSFRSQNIYCLPWNAAEDVWLNMNCFRDASLAKLVHPGNFQNYKYSALNVIPLSCGGSIEFRHYPGTLDFTGKFSDWIRIIMLMKKLAYRYDNVNEVLDGYKHGDLQSYMKPLLQTKPINLMKGYRLAKNLARLTPTIRTPPKLADKSEALEKFCKKHKFKPPTKVRPGALEEYLLSTTKTVADD